MTKNMGPDEEQRWFEEQMGEALKTFDAAYERQAPDLVMLEAFAAQHQREQRKKMWKELALFWLVAACLLLGMMWVLERHFIWFVALQVLVAAGGLGFVGISYFKKVSRLWKSG